MTDSPRASHALEGELPAVRGHELAAVVAVADLVEVVVPDVVLHGEALLVGALAVPMARSSGLSCGIPAQDTLLRVIIIYAPEATGARPRRTRAAGPPVGTPTASGTPAAASSSRGR